MAHVEESWRDQLDPAVRRAFNEIRDMVQTEFLQVRLHTQEIEQIKKTLAEQSTNAETLKKIDAFMNELAVSLVWANRIRAIVLWIGAPVTVGIGIWKAWKGLE